MTRSARLRRSGPIRNGHAVAAGEGYGPLVTAPDPVEPESASTSAVAGPRGEGVRDTGAPGADTHAANTHDVGTSEADAREAGTSETGASEADAREAHTPDAGTPDADAREAEWAARPLDPRDYSRRTHLANERTFLAWWRTGLTALAAALGAARVVPELSNAHERWPYTLLGVACAVAGILAIAYGHRRRIAVEEGLAAGTFPPVDRRVTAVLTGVALAIGVGMLVLIVTET